MKRPTRETCAALAAAIDRYVEKADTSLGDFLRRAGYPEVPATLKEAQALEDKLMHLLRSMARVRAIEIQRAGGLEIYSILGGILGNEDITDRIEQAELVRHIATVFERSFMALMPKLVRAYSARIDDKLAIAGITKRTEHFINTWSYDLAQLMKLGTDKEIKRILDNGLKNGLSVEKVTQEIMDGGIRSPRWRARRAALTEMLRAHSYAQLDAYKQNPAVNAKMWRHTGAKFSVPRENHVAMSGTVVAVDQPFTLIGANGGIYHPQCPRDTSLPASESVNCHCLLQPVVDENILGMSLEERDRLWQEARDADDRAWAAELDVQKRIEALRFRGEDTSDAEAELVALTRKREQAEAAPKRRGR